MHTYSTRDMKEAGFIWAQGTLNASFKGLEASGQPELRGVYRFTFEIDATRDEFTQLLHLYTNQEATVEPKTYDQKMNNLRDHLSRAKHNR